MPTHHSPTAPELVPIDCARCGIPIWDLDGTHLCAVCIGADREAAAWARAEARDESAREDAAAGWDGGGL